MIFFGKTFAEKTALSAGRDAEHEIRKGNADALSWRTAYETLVFQTGRDLNDGLGLDPRIAPLRSKDEA